MSHDPELRRAILRALERMRKGKDGYLDTLPARLLHALEEAPLVEEASLGITRPMRMSGELSPREKQIVHAASLGMTNRMIGELYGLAEDTVKTHMRRIRFKLGAKDRTHAVGIALRPGPDRVRRRICSRR
jgi:DNA-binding NarL/FixJ family response regulator